MKKRIRINMFLEFEIVYLSFIYYLFICLPIISFVFLTSFGEEEIENKKKDKIKRRGDKKKK